MSDFIPGAGYIDSSGCVKTASGYRLLYSLATLGPTDAIDTGALETDSVSQIYVLLFNGNTTQQRAPVFSHIGENGVVVLDTTSPAAIAANTKARYVFGVGASTTGLTNAYGIPPASKFKLTAAAPASGTGDGAIYIWGR